MRKRTLVVLCLILLILLVMQLLLNPTFNRQFHRWGKQQYYVVILDEGVREPVSGQALSIYSYHLPAFDASGKQKNLTFTAIKLLRQKAYLRVYAKQDGTVTAWEEVYVDQIPIAAQIKLLPLISPAIIKPLE